MIGPARAQRVRAVAWVALALMALLGPVLFRAGSVRPVDPAASAKRAPGTRLLELRVQPSDERSANGASRDEIVLFADELRDRAPEIEDGPPVADLRQAPPQPDGESIWLLRRDRWFEAEGAAVTATGTRTFWLGTDRVGRDVLALVVRASRISLLLGFSAALVATLIGCTVGLLAGAGPRWLDGLLMRGTEAVLAFPQLLAVLLLAVLLQPGPVVVVLILGLLSWMGSARLVRAEALRLRDADFVRAALASGAGRGRVLLRHLLPNAVGPALAVAPLLVGDSILVESALAFLGMGAGGETPSWGRLVAEGRGDLVTAWWITLFPGLAITLTVLLTQNLTPGDRLDRRAMRAPTVPNPRSHEPEVLRPAAPESSRGTA